MSKMVLSIFDSEPISVSHTQLLNPDLAPVMHKKLNPGPTSKNPVQLRILMLVNFKFFNCIFYIHCSYSGIDSSRIFLS